MGKLTACVLGLLFGIGATFFSYNYHVVRAEKEWLCVPRKQAGLSDIYADVRSWRPADWQEHAELVKSLVAHGRSDLVALPAARGLFNDLLDGVRPKRVGEADGETSAR